MSPTFEYDMPMPLRVSRATSPVPSRRTSHSYLHPSTLPTLSTHKYSPSSRAADISRLLDPSYLSTSASTSSSPASVSAYVDHHGDLHDPDYRDFPALTPRRPAWERTLDDDDLYTSPDEDAAFDDFAPRRARTQRRRYATPSFASYSYTPAAAVADATNEKKRPRRKLCRTRDDAWALAEEEESLRDAPQAPKQEDYVPMHHDAQDWTPTCTQNFRRHWQAFSLSLRFSIFRAQRRIKRKVGI